MIRTQEVLIRLARENVADSGKRAANGRVPLPQRRHDELDVTQARTLLESTRASVPRLQVAMRQSANALATLLGRAARRRCVAVRVRRPFPAPALVAAHGGAGWYLLRCRPDIRSAELTAAAPGGPRRDGGGGPVSPPVAVRRDRL